MDNILDILESLEVPIDNEEIDNDTIDYIDNYDNIDIDKWLLEV